MKRRATVKDWDKLRKTGKGLATGDAPALGQSPTVTLWPNGSQEVWVESGDEVWVKSGDTRLGFSIQFSEGTHGLSARLYFFGGTFGRNSRRARFAVRVRRGSLSVPR